MSSAGSLAGTGARVHLGVIVQAARRPGSCGIVVYSHTHCSSKARAVHSARLGARRSACEYHFPSHVPPRWHAACRRQL